MQKLLVTMKDVQRHKVIKDVIEKRLTGVEAASLLGLTPVHISRLKAKLLRGGFEEILRKPPALPPNSKISGTESKKILKLRKELYYDFNIMHFMDKLHEVHKLPYCYESIRKLLIRHNLHSPKKKKKVHRMRRRMPKSGMLIQMDSSQHFWLPQVENKWWLIAMIDDATNEVPYAAFFPKDTAYANMHVLRRFIEIKGLFMALYVDKASHFKTTRHGGIHYNISSEQNEETQIERALAELGINIIPANSPQAKGRIEVTFRLFQDRLIKEMRLEGIKNYTQANKFLEEEFLLWYNAKYTHQAESSYMPLAKDKNLDLSFCIKKERIVKGDNTVSIYGQAIQIPPSDIRPSFTKARVSVCLLEDKRIYVLYQGKVIAESSLSKNNKLIKKDKETEEFLNSREYVNVGARRAHKPIENHPWKRALLRAGALRNRTLQEINI
jgi:hypothetical protein